MLWHPWKVAVLGIAAWLLIRYLMPIEPIYPMGGTAMLYIVLCYAAFFVGCFITHLLAPDSDNRRHYGWNGQLNSYLYWITMAVGVGGILARLFDRTYRGVDYFAGSAEVRDALANTSATVVGAAAGAMVPFCYLPMMLLLASRPGVNYLRLLGLSAFVFVLPTLEGLGQLSRIYILICAFLLFAMISLLRFNGQIFRAKIMVPGIIVALGISVVSSAILEIRLQDRSSRFTLTDSLYDSVFAQSIAPNETAREKIYAGRPFERAVYQSVTPQALYYTSGFYEFSRLMDRPDEQYFAWGSYLMWPYTKLASVALGTKKITGLYEDLLFPRIGVFTTFFGPWWVDFGWIGVFLMVLMGAGVTRLSAFARRGYVNVLPLYLYAIMIIFYFPVVNLLISGNGFFSVHGLILFAIFTSFQAGAAHFGDAGKTRQAATMRGSIARRLVRRGEPV